MEFEGIQGKTVKREEERGEKQQDGNQGIGGRCGDADRGREDEGTGEENDGNWGLVRNLGEEIELGRKTDGKQKTKPQCLGRGRGRGRETRGKNK